MFSPIPALNTTVLSSAHTDTQPSSTTTDRAEFRQADNIDIGLMKKSLEAINLIISELADRPDLKDGVIEQLQCSVTEIVTDSLAEDTFEEDELEPSEDEPIDKVAEEAFTYSSVGEGEATFSYSMDVEV